MKFVMPNLQERHPEWYHATDYHWLDEHDEKRYVHTMSDCDINKLDDINRRNIANWFREDYEN